MNLNSQQIEKFLIFHENLQKGQPQQIGWDLTIQKITQIQGGSIFIEKAEIQEYKEVEIDDYGDGKECWMLAPGVYSLTFDQGIKLDGSHWAKIIQRSSLLRVGTQIISSVFDCGFECNNIGATMFVNIPVKIEKGARIAQIIISENYEVEADNLYGGKNHNSQFFGDNDKK